MYEIAESNFPNSWLTSSNRIPRQHAVCNTACHNKKDSEKPTQKENWAIRKCALEKSHQRDTKTNK